MSAAMETGPRNERGVALVMAIVVLLVISLLASAVMQNLSTQRKISGHGLRTSRALSAADAGVAEVVSRMRTGEIALNEDVEASAVQIFLTTSGLVPSVGDDTTALATAQPPGDWLDYSSATRGEDVLTLGFRRDPDTGAIVRYDDEQSPTLNTTCGMPVYRVTSTGKINGDRTRIQAEFIWKPHHLNVNAALCSGVDVHLEGDASICGYQHAADTGFEDAALGRTGSPSCVHHEVGMGNLPGIWSGGSVTNNGAQIAGIPTATIEAQSGFYDGPWELLGMTRTEFVTMLGTHTTAPANWDGVVWLDDDSSIQNGLQAFDVDALTGEGILYVDGDLHLTGLVAFRGLIYVEGDFTSEATGTVVGAVVVRGRSESTCTLTNGPAMVYSRDAINRALGRALREIITLSWREVR
jgi:hypothetical protein